MTVFSDDFNRADNASLGAGWTDRNNTMGIDSNAAFPTTPSLYCTSTYNTVMGTNDMEVTVTIGSLFGASANATFVVLGANTSGESVVALWTEAASTLDILSMTGWDPSTGSTLQNSATATFAPGDTLTLQRGGNVCTGLKNGSAISGSSWTDGGNVLPRDSSHRITGMGGLGTATKYRHIDAWSATDAMSLKANAFLVTKPSMVRASHY